MPKNEDSVISHWYQLFEGLQESPIELYKSIESAVLKRELPETSISRVNYFEGGLLSAQREYLRVSRKDLIFDICVAHYGKGMFVSWWLSKDRSTNGFWKLIVVLLFFFPFLSIFVNEYGFLLGLFFAILSLFILILVISTLIRMGTIKGEDTLLEIPLIGGIYERLFHPITYYKQDTELMFQESVRRAVNEALDDMRTTKGLKVLTEDEKKPILTNLFKH